MQLPTAIIIASAVLSAALVATNRYTAAVAANSGGDMTTAFVVDRLTGDAQVCTSTPNAIIRAQCRRAIWPR
jgi:hypothetical protein